MNKGERQVKAVRGMFIAWMELFFDVAATDKTTILLPAITGHRLSPPIPQARAAAAAVAGMIRAVME